MALAPARLPLPLAAVQELPQTGSDTAGWGDAEACRNAGKHHFMLHLTTHCRCTFNATPVSSAALPDSRCFCLSSTYFSFSCSASTAPATSTQAPSPISHLHLHSVSAVPCAIGALKCKEPLAESKQFIDHASQLLAPSLPASKSITGTELHQGD
ncbi:hypothetical protein IWX92DRAFT_81936 [Phyllosticta citricarpa]